MEWLIFALLAPILWAFTNVIDKFLLEKHIRNPISYEIFITIFNLIGIITVLLIARVSTDLYGAFLSIISGGISVIAVVFYNNSMIHEEASRVIPIVYFSSIFVSILAYVFLGEFFNLEKYLGIIFIFLGGVLISYKKIDKKWCFSSAIKFALISAFLWAISSILTKYTLGFIDFYTLTVWQLVGYFIFGPLFLLSDKVRTNFLEITRKFNKKIFVLMTLNSLIYLVAVLSFFYAISIGKVSLVYSVISTQPFFIFIYMLIISKLAPKIVKEEIDKSTIILKLVAVFLIFFGSWLIVF